ncbi:MAG: fused MFS/spermidine synthase, partial [Deltaproteobacteria bacterium]|nr:fused MFS/spermidine synthase [Deltaproteobacteria bacterium]
MKLAVARKQQKNGVEDPATHYPLLLVLFFFSGLTGLIYEVLWTRMIVKIIGSAPFAVSIVLTVFMGGLALGSYIASRTVDRVTEPFKLIPIYGILELITGGFALLLPALLFLFELFYRNIYDRLFQYFFLYNFITFIGCSLLLIIPTTSMGATLPVLSRFFITSMARVSSPVGKLYGVNTIGAAAGALLGGFWLINYLGIKGTLTLAVSINLLIGAVCLLLVPLGKDRKGLNRVSLEATTGGRKTSQASKGFVRPRSQAERVSALVLFGVSGFCAMAYEVIWTKLLSLIVGPTTYSFTIVLVTFILGLALGSLFFGWLGDRVRDPIYVLLLTQGIAALFALWISHALGNSQIFFAKLILHYRDEFTQLQFLKAFILFSLLLFPTFFLGGTFPLVGRICTRSLSQTGKSIGFAYAINSIGAIGGSFCAGFLLVPLLGKEVGLKFVIAFQLIMAIFFGAYLFRKANSRLSVNFSLALVLFSALVLVFPLPHWDRKMLSIGRYHRFERPEVVKMGWVEALFRGSKKFAQDQEGDVVYFGDGIAGFTTVLKVKLDIFGNEGYALYISGKPEASSRLDMDTQTISAHFPMLFHKNPKRVLVIGLASGITAGEVLYYPVDRLDVVDINRQVIPASRFFDPWNNRVL